MGCVARGPGSIPAVGQMKIKPPAEFPPAGVHEPDPVKTAAVEKAKTILRDAGFDDVMIEFNLDTGNVRIIPLAGAKRDG
jgi:hypothetical protein